MRKLKIYYTSDTHGNLLPVDYAGRGTKAGGLLPIAHEIRRDQNTPVPGGSGSRRDENTPVPDGGSHRVENTPVPNGRSRRDENTLVLDGGDSLQGTPLAAYYLEHAEDFASHPVADAFGAMGLNAFTLGNHDFNFGYEAVCSYVRAMNAHGAVCICANVDDLGGRIPIVPWHIFTLGNGLRIGITGAVTDYVNVWEKPEHLAQLRVRDSVKAVSKALEEMRLAGCDMTVCIYHGGYEKDLATGRVLSESLENRACLLGETLGFDLLLTGHQHIAVEQTWLGRTFSCQPSDRADNYLVVEGTIEEDCLTSGKAGRCPVWTFSSRLVYAGTDWEKTGFEKLLQLEAKTQAWLDEKIGSFAEPLLPESKLDAALYGSKVAAFINQVQLENIPADVFCTSLTNDPIGFEKQVSIRDVYTAYPFANVSVKKQVSGHALRLALERCASYLELADGAPVISERFLKPKVEHYNYDFYAGLDYAFDLRRPVGDRVVRLCFLDGRPIEDTETYTLVCSDYRASGTGGYEMIGECPVLFTGADNMQDLLVSYLRAHKDIKPAENVKFQVIF